jgi:hypothetical protein
LPLPPTKRQRSSNWFVSAIQHGTQADAIRRRSVDREKAKACVSFLGRRWAGALHAKLKAAHENWKTAKDDSALVEEVVTLSGRFGKQREDAGAIRRLWREDLALICFEYVSA